MPYDFPTGMGIVPESDSKILNKLVKECRDPKERERLQALCILSIGYSVSEVSRMFFVDEDTVYADGHSDGMRKGVAGRRHSARRRRRR